MLERSQFCDNFFGSTFSSLGAAGCLLFVPSNLTSWGAESSMTSGTGGGGGEGEGEGGTVSRRCALSF